MAPRRSHAQSQSAQPSSPALDTLLFWATAADPCPFDLVSFNNQALNQHLRAIGLKGVNLTKPNKVAVVKEAAEQLSALKGVDLLVSDLANRHLGLAAHNICDHVVMKVVFGPWPQRELPCWLYKGLCQDPYFGHSKCHLVNLGLTP